MKHTKIIIAAALALALTACSDTNTAEVSDLPDITESSTVLTEDTTTAEETTTTTTTTAEVTTASETETTEEETETGAVNEDIKSDVLLPDREFLKNLFNWHVDPLNPDMEFAMGGSPLGEAYAVYMDIDGDTVKDFCFVIETAHGSPMIVCNYEDNAWTVKNVITVIWRHTYLQTDNSGATNLFVVNGNRWEEGLDSYVYKNGVEEHFELFNMDERYPIDPDVGIPPLLDVADYDAAIDEALQEYDNLTLLYDYPYAETQDFYAICDNAEGGEEALDKFLRDVESLFVN